MHEGAHWLIHRPAFAADNPFGSPGLFENQYLAAKEGRIDYSRSTRERNDIERIERQADFLASAMLMPKTTLRMAFVEFFGYYHERPRAIVRGKSSMDDSFAKLLPEFVAERFNVSKRAALIRLEKLDAITGKPSLRFGAASP
jgi:Zn-dependent peptidase ImmA (M78 family)